jgi:hypothetical protein
MASPTVYTDQRYLMGPHYASSYDLTVGNAPTFDLAKDKLKIAGTAVTLTAAEFNILDDVTATAAEINAAADRSTKVVTIANATNTLSLTAALHAGRIAYVLDATLAITLPEATGTGDVYTVVQGIAATSSTIVTADTSNAGFRGMLQALDADNEATLTSWPAAVAGTDDTLTFNGTSTGGRIGDHFTFTDVATDKWLVAGQITESGGSEVTPFSSAA